MNALPRHCAALPPPLTRYSPEWSDLARLARAELAAHFGDEVATEHVGSTAVPGLVARAIIDLAVGLPPGRALTAAHFLKFRALGYTYQGEGPEGELVFFRQGDGASASFQLHVVQDGGPRWRDLCRFTRLLRANPDLRDHYAAFKRELGSSRQYSEDYGKLKAEWAGFALREGA